MLRHPLCQPKSFHSPDFWYIARRTGWLLDTSDQLHHPQPFYSLGNHELFTGPFTRLTWYMWHLKSQAVKRLMSHPSECTCGYTCSHICAPGKVHSHSLLNASPRCSISGPFFCFCCLVSSLSCSQRCSGLFPRHYS